MTSCITKNANPDGVVHRLWIIRLMTVMILLVCTACGTLPTKENITGSKSYLHVMDYWTGNFQRSYYVHFPADYHPNESLPLVVVVHGAFDTGKGMEKFSGFSRLSDKERFIVMYPNGIGILGFLQHWNAGHCCGKAADDQIDDVGFVSAAIDDLCSKFNVDRKRIYMTGFSNGGMFTYRFGAEKSDMLAAIAPLAASLGGKSSPDMPEWRSPEPSQPLSILVMHGLTDDDVPFEGGASNRRGGTRSTLSVMESIGFWIEQNGCQDTPVTEHFCDGAVLQTTWTGCRDQTQVVLITLGGWGHSWPGPYFTRSLDADQPLYHFDAAEIIWDFFTKHARN
ncbi:MAG: PHB depolymerase family esterase [Desulfatirhabdiaceae bacterium]